jgi:acetyl-CoA C-acetyltransferase
MVAGGVESISCVQNEANRHMRTDPAAGAKPEIYWSMLQTAEQVAKRYNIPRSAGRIRRAQPAARRRRPQAAGKFDDEIVPMTPPWAWSTRPPAA